MISLVMLLATLLGDFAYVHIKNSALRQKNIQRANDTHKIDALASLPHNGPAVIIKAKQIIAVEKLDPNKKGEDGKQK